MRRTQVLVVGSGAGGAVTAALLAEAGFSVTLLEEGPRVAPGTHGQFSRPQMRAQYRDRGQSVALGLPPILYPEGRCLGGATEVNAGLYRRADVDLLDRWSREWNIEALTGASLAPFAEVVEADMGVTYSSQLSPGEEALLRGAARNGWAVTRAGRMRHTNGGRDSHQSMMTSYLPRAVSAGAVVVSNARVDRLHMHGGKAFVASYTGESGAGRYVEHIAFDHVFICAGAIQSAALLLRSGIRRNVGRSLAMHPSVKMLASFDHDLGMTRDVPCVQVTASAPHVTLQGAASSLPMIGLAMTRAGQDITGLRENAGQLGMFSATICGETSGRVRVVSGRPVVTFALSGPDLAALDTGLQELARLLDAGGASWVVPAMAGGQRNQGGTPWPDCNRPRRFNADLMSAHLMSTVPMGEDHRRCAVDSWGRSHEIPNVYVNDSAILPSAPGVNPQGTVMAIAMRNADAFIRGTSQPS